MDKKKTMSEEDQKFVKENFTYDPLSGEIKRNGKKAPLALCHLNQNATQK